jgi:hypothetical protein
LDLQLQRERDAAAAAAAAAAKPQCKALEDMAFGERMRYEVINSFKQVQAGQQMRVITLPWYLWSVM